MIDTVLGNLPTTLSFCSFGAAGSGYGNQATSRIVTLQQCQPTVCDQRPEVSTQSRRINLHDVSQITRPNRPQFDDMRKQRVLSAYQPCFPDFKIVILGNASHKLAQLLVCAALRLFNDGVWRR